MIAYFIISFTSISKRNSTCLHACACHMIICWTFIFRRICSLPPCRMCQVLILDMEQSICTTRESRRLMVVILIQVNSMHQNTQQMTLGCFVLKWSDAARDLCTTGDRVHLLIQRKMPDAGTQENSSMFQYLVPSTRGAFA